MGKEVACGRERTRRSGGQESERGANPSIVCFYHDRVAIHASNADVLCSTAGNATIGANVLSGATGALGLFNGCGGRWCACTRGGSNEERKTDAVNLDFVKIIVNAELNQ